MESSVGYLTRRSPRGLNLKAFPVKFLHHGGYNVYFRCEVVGVERRDDIRPTVMLRRCVLAPAHRAHMSSDRKTHCGRVRNLFHIISR